jgi:hypothetical protein
MRYFVFSPTEGPAYLLEHNPPVGDNGDRAARVEQVARGSADKMHMLANRLNSLDTMGAVAKTGLED